MDTNRWVACASYTIVYFGDNFVSWQVQLGNALWHGREWPVLKNLQNWIEQDFTLSILSSGTFVFLFLVPVLVSVFPHLCAPAPICSYYCVLVGFLGLCWCVHIYPFVFLYPFLCILVHLHLSPSLLTHSMTHGLGVFTPFSPRIQVFHELPVRK